ncbi:MAG: hypothetical protein ACTHJ2_00355 [Candidatus Nitrosocosmicus sp.]
MFKEGYEPEDVVIELDKEADTIIRNYADYSRLKRMDCVVTVHYAIKKNFPLFMQLFSRFEEKGFNENIFSKLLEKQKQYSTKVLDKLLAFYHNRISELKYRKSAFE